MFENLNNIQFLIAAAGFLSTLIMGLGTLSWRIAKAESALESKIEAALYQHDLDISTVRREMLEIKLNFESDFVRKDMLRDSLTDLGARLVRLEGKLDTAIAVVRQSTKI